MLTRERAILERTPATIRMMLAGIPDSLAHATYGLNTFSPYAVVGHLIIGERTDWIPRAKIILEHGTSRPFDPFDPTATILPQDGPRTDQLIEDFASLRRDNLEALADFNLSPEDLNRTGTHPALGEVTLGQLISAWVCHDLHHLAQICKALAHQWTNETGPWQSYLGILTK